MSGTACFAVFFVVVARLVIEMPAVEEGLSRAVDLQAWGWRFVGFCVAGFAILWFVPGRSRDDTPGQRGCGRDDSLGEQILSVFGDVGGRPYHLVPLAVPLGPLS